MTREQEANVLRDAARIMAKYRGGLGTTIAILAETEQALRAPAEGEPRS